MINIARILVSALLTWPALCPPAMAQVLTGRGVATSSSNSRLEQGVVLLGSRVDANAAGVMSAIHENQQLGAQVEMVIRALCPTCTGMEGRQPVPASGASGLAPLSGRSDATRTAAGLGGFSLPSCEEGEYITSNGASLLCRKLPPPELYVRANASSAPQCDFGDFTVALPNLSTLLCSKAPTSLLFSEPKYQK